MAASRHGKLVRMLICGLLESTDRSGMDREYKMY